MEDQTLNQATQFTNAQQAILVAAIIVILAVAFLFVFLFTHSPEPENRIYSDVFTDNQKPIKSKGVKNV